MGGGFSDKCKEKTIKIYFIIFLLNSTISSTPHSSLLTWHLFICMLVGGGGNVKAKFSHTSIPKEGEKILG